MTSPAPQRSRTIDVLCVALVLAGTVRLLAIVLHEPLLGYANQYDMVRSSACVDLWPALPGPTRYGAHQAAPVSHYVSGHIAGGPCYPSSVLVFVEAARVGVAALRGAGFLRTTDFPLRAVGLVEALALIALVLAFIAAERRRPRARLAHGALLALVFSDPAMAMWMNTLYTEFAAAFFLYAVGGLLALAPAPSRSLAADRWRLGAGWAAWAAALAGLVWSRQQYAVFAVLPLLIAAPQGWRNRRLAWTGAAIVVIASAGLQTSLIAGLPALHQANRHDAYLGAFLPSARDEARAIEELGLPAACREAVGSNWYVGMGADAQHECREVEALGPLAFLRLVPDDPGLPARALLRGLPLAQVWWQHHLGMIAGTSFGDWSHARGPLAWSLANPVERLPLTSFLALLAALAAAFVALVVAWIADAIRGGTTDGWVRAALYASAVGIFGPVSAIFGDGFVEVSRHAIVLYPAIAALAILAAGRAFALADRNQGIRLQDAKVVAAWVITASLIATVLTSWARSWPLGQGVVDLPRTRAMAGSTYAIRGWAIDPWGVRSVRVEAFRDLAARIPERIWLAAAGREVRGSQNESLAAYFPNYPGAARGGFALDIARSDWPEAAPCLRTIVENRLGVATEIDRRCVAR